MFEITIKGETLEELTGNINRIAALYHKEASYQEDDAAREELQSKRRAGKNKATPAPEPQSEPAEGADIDLERELNEAVPPAPTGSTAIVDAGTGQPVAQAEPVKQMTMDDVRASAAKLAAKDTPKLTELIKKYGGTNLSSIPKDKLGDFAGDVVEALG